MDDAFSKSYIASEAIRCIHVALLCVQDQTADRPCMADVVFLLSSETDRPHPKQPIFTFQRSPNSDHQSQKTSKLSFNEATIKMIEGR